MWSRTDFENTLRAVLQGDWLAHRKLIYYFNLENRSYKKADPEKEEQKRICFQTTLQAANNNNPEANAFLGVLYRDGIGVEKDLELSLQYIRAARSYQNTTGLYLLGWCHYWGVGLEKDTAKGLELLREAANLGHVGAAAELGSVLNAGDEKARWNSFAREQGDPNALNALCCPEMRGNPFGLYIPQNKDLSITWKEAKEVSGVVQGKVYYKTTGYEVTIAYTGPINIGEIPKKTLAYPYDEGYKNAMPYSKINKAQLCFFSAASALMMPVGFCICVGLCVCHKSTMNCLRDSVTEDDDRARIADSIASVSWERDLSEMIREADRIITQRVEHAKNNSANQHPFFPQSLPPAGPPQYGAEGMPLLGSHQNPSAPPPYSPVVSIYKPLEIGDEKERVVHIQGGASLRMGGIRKSNS